MVDLQTQGSDEKAQLGQLHHQVLSLRMSEAKAVKREEEERGRVLRLEAGLLKCERERDRAEERVFRVRSECQGKVKHLRNTVQVCMYCMYLKLMYTCTCTARFVRRGEGAREGEYE